MIDFGCRVVFFFKSKNENNFNKKSEISCICSSNHSKSVEELSIRMCFSFFPFCFIFHAQSGTSNNYQNRSSDKSYYGSFSFDSNDI